MTAVRTLSNLAGLILGSTTVLAVAVGPAWGGAAPPPATVDVIGGVPAAARVAGGAVGGGVALDGLRIGAALAGAARVSVTLDLAFRDEPGAEVAATAAATPGSPTYGRFLSPAQFDARYGPRPAGVRALRTWLAGEGLSVDAEVGDQALVVHGAAAAVSHAFGGVELRTAGANGATGVLAAGQLRMPVGLAATVAAVGGLGGPRPEAVTSSVVADPDPRVATARAATGQAVAGTSTGASTPPCATWFGQLPPGVPGPAPFRATLSSAPECSAFADGRYYSAASTAKLRTLDSFDPRYLGQARTVGIVLWGSDDNVRRAANAQARLNGVAVLRPGQYANVLSRTRTPGCVPVTADVHLEQNLDVQAIRVDAPAARIRYYADTRCQAPELSLATAVAQDKVSILTNSWVYPNLEYDPADPDGRVFALGDLVHKSLVKAAAEGITVLFCTGDSGGGVLARTSRHLRPGYPATDPFAVAVGGIGFGTSETGSVAFRSGWTDTEYVYAHGWHRVSPYVSFGPNGIGSSGGVSQVWQAPAWQRRAHVAVRGRRVVPDLSNAASAEFDPFLEVQVLGGTATPEAVAGTSVAAPLTAGEVAGALVAERRARFGLITPALYAQRHHGVVTDVFFRHDAVGGTNPLGQSVLFGEELPGEALRSKPGWDDVTGLGIPGPRFYQLIGR